MSISRLYSPLLLFIAGQLACPGLTARADTAMFAAGQDVTLSSSADGSLPFSYQWYKDARMLAGATDDTFEIEDFHASDAGVYTVKISNYLGSTTSDVATLVLTAPPVITMPPASQAVSVGKAVTFAVTATGAPAPTYQWLRNGSSIPGAIGSSYTIASVVTTQAGSYSVVVKNVSGSIRSAGAVLTVNPPDVAPVITVPPASQTVIAGKAVTFAATATGAPAPTCQWLKNGASIPGATGSSYTIASAAMTHAGNYSVVVTNPAGTATSAAAVLTVIPPDVAPVITVPPASQTVTVGQPVTLTVTASGTPAPTYQWLKNGSSIPGATGSSYTIASAATTHAGNYSVVVTNPAGTATSAAAVLTVNPPAAPPVITVPPASQTVAVGKPVTLAVTVTGWPVPTYQWLKNGASIAGATSSSYTIASVVTTQAGSYSVVVKNVSGSIRSSGAVLTVYYPLPVHADFNGDGKSDLLMENILTGQHSLWLMAGTSIGSTLTLNTLSTDWEIVALGEFNGDGKTDVLWQNLTTRECSVWLMAGTGLASTLSLGVPAAGMQIVGAGDFNADGKTDILWLDRGTGQYSIRLMNGVTPGATITLGAFSADWSIAGTGDFNGDGKTDILWERPADGASGLWLMNGTAYAGWADLPAMPGGWHVGGTGDFNGDGKIDILWQNDLTGVCKVALMSGLTKSGEVTLGVVLPGWILVN